MHTKFERLLSKSVTTLEVMTYYLVVHTGPRKDGQDGAKDYCKSVARGDITVIGWAGRDKTVIFVGRGCKKEGRRRVRR